MAKENAEIFKESKIGDINIRQIWDKWVDDIPTPTKRKVLYEICRSINVDIVANMDEIRAWLKQIPLEEILEEIMED